MKIDAVRTAILLTWLLGITAIVIGYWLTPFTGCVFGLLAIGFLRSPYIDDTKTVPKFAVEQKLAMYGLLGLGVGGAIWLFVESMRQDHVYTSIADGFANHFYWVPLVPLLLFVFLYDLWLFRRGSTGMNE